MLSMYEEQLRGMFVCLFSQSVTSQKFSEHLYVPSLVLGFEEIIVINSVQALPSYFCRGNKQ